MASYLPEILFETNRQAPAPSKDYYQVVTTRDEVFPRERRFALRWNCDSRLQPVAYRKYFSYTWKPEVILRWWKISLRSEFRDARPGEYRESHQDFLDDTSLQAQIAIVFGGKILEYILNLCRGNFDFLERLPKPLLLYIITFLDLEDVTRLSQVSHTLEKICNSEQLWEQIVVGLCDTITPEMRELAKELGWKQIFFTNKLQLQLQLRRRRQYRALSKDDLPDFD